MTQHERGTENHPFRLCKWFKFSLWVVVGYLLSLLLAGVVHSQAGVAIINRAGATYNDPATGTTINTTSGQVRITQLIDPFGQILDCSGNEFADYTGFRVGLFEQASPLGELGSLVSLTPTTALTGLAPNILNVNPYDVTNTPVSGKRGVYNFLLNPSTGQTAIGRTYILLITPPAGSGLSERRIRLQIVSLVGNVLSYTATALDGRAIGTDGQVSLNLTTLVTDANNIPLTFVTLPVNLIVCQAQPIQITKTGDRAQAEPGDTALYRVSVKNLSSAPVTNPVITDSLPLGFQFVSGSARAAIGNTQVPVTVTANGRSLTFNIGGTIPAVEQNQLLNLVYAVQITPDAVRGDGRNSAIAQGLLNSQIVKDGPAIYRLLIRQGILSDCGTIIGKVFEDKNFDGEQQEGEPGIPNAVILMDDGNRIQADSRGLFSVRCVKPGPRTLVLDLSSIPGYQIAPNNYILERNSPSRLVRMSPGSLGRANFAVIPYKPEGGEKK